MTKPEHLTGIAWAQEVRARRAAEKALADPIRLRMAARIFRQARVRGLVDDEGNVVDAEDLNRIGEVGASVGSEDA